jgi:hypothetical protein
MTRRHGYWRFRPSCTDGPGRTRLSGLMICTTSCVIRRSCLWHGTGSGGTGGRARPFLGELREQLKQRRFAPLPVRERLIPKADGRKRRLGIPTVIDRIVQAAAKLVL